MEHQFGHDFTMVRVHTDSEAANTARALGARAFSRGRDIVFADGEYRPGTADGEVLLTHELAHVVQHARASSIEPRVSAPGEASERDADQAADAVARGAPVRLPAPAGGVAAVHRQAAGTDLRLQPSTWFLRSMGRLVIDDFPTGSATLSDAQRAEVQAHAVRLRALLEMDAGGRITVTGHGDAIGSEQRNLELGLARAEAIRAEFVAAGVPEELIDIDSAGESDPAVPGTSAEPRNRRAVVGFSPALRLPVLPPRHPELGPASGGVSPSPEAALGTDRYQLPDLRIPPCTLMPELCGLGPIPPYAIPGPDLRREIPPPPPTHDGLRDFFERDPLLRLLPDELRDAAISGLESAPDAIAGEIAGQLPFEGETAEAIDALLRALARYMQGERWTPPVDRGWRYDMPQPQPFPRMPGEQIFRAPGIPLDPFFVPQF